MRNGTIGTTLGEKWNFDFLEIITSPELPVFSSRQIPVFLWLNLKWIHIPKAWNRPYFVAADVSSEIKKKTIFNNFRKRRVPMNSRYSYEQFHVDFLKIASTTFFIRHSIRSGEGNFSAYLLAITRISRNYCKSTGLVRGPIFHHFFRSGHFRFPTWWKVSLDKHRLASLFFLFFGLLCFNSHTLQVSWTLSTTTLWGHDDFVPRCFWPRSFRIQMEIFRKLQIATNIIDSGNETWKLK